MPLTRNTTLGLLAILISTVLLGWSLAGKPDPFARHYTIWAEFPDAATIIRFDRDVRLAGVNVGTVGKITRHGDLARVQLELDPDLRDEIHTDATAEIRPHTIFDGNAFVDLHAGSASAPALSAGATLPRAQTSNAVSLDKALRTLAPATRRDLRSLLSSSRQILGDRERHALRHTLTAAAPVLRDTAQWTRALQGPTGDELTGAIRGLSTTADALARHRTALAPILHATTRTAKALQPGDALSRTLSTLPASLRASRTGAVALRRTITAIKPLAVDLVPAMHELDPTLRDLRPVLAKADPVLGRARPFIGRLRAAMTAINRSATPTVALLDALRAPVQKTHDEVVPYLRSKTPAGPTVAEALASMASSATGTLAPVQSPAQAGTSGPGHAFYVSLLSSVELGCTTIPAGTVQTLLKTLGACTP